MQLEVVLSGNRGGRRTRFKEAMFNCGSLIEGRNCANIKTYEIYDCCTTRQVVKVELMQWGYTEKVKESCR